MTYLIAKLALLILTAAILSFILGHWWARRNFVDVSESFEALIESNNADRSLWDRLWHRLDAIPVPESTDLSAVYDRLDDVSLKVDTLPKVDPASFASVNSRIDALSENVRKIPYPIALQAKDLEPVLRKLEVLDEVVRAIPAPEKPAIVDLAPVTQNISKLQESVHNIPKPPPARDVDLVPIQDELASLRAAIKSMPPVPASPAVDLDPLSRRLSSLERTVQAIPRPERADLSAVDRRLNSIEAEIRVLSKRLARPAVPQPVVTPKKENTGPVLLKSAIHGAGDDLKKVSGIGPALERLLNQNGVHYYWQISSWSSRDVKFIDERLDVFHGRIERDNWVSQAKKLKQQPGAAAEPGKPGSSAVQSIDQLQGARREPAAGELS